jgi:hypothetical protein
MAVQQGPGGKNLLKSVEEANRKERERRAQERERRAKRDRGELPPPRIQDIAGPTEQQVRDALAGSSLTPEQIDAKAKELSTSLPVVPEVKQAAQARERGDLGTARRLEAEAANVTEESIRRMEAAHLTNKRREEQQRAEATNVRELRETLERDVATLNEREQRKSEGQQAKVKAVLDTIDDEGGLASAIQASRITRTEARLAGFTDAQIDGALKASREAAFGGVDDEGKPFAGELERRTAVRSAASQRSVLNKISRYRTGNTYNIGEALYDGRVTPGELRLVFSNAAVTGEQRRNDARRRLDAAGVDIANPIDLTAALEAGAQATDLVAVGIPVTSIQAAEEVRETARAIETAALRERATLEAEKGNAKTALELRIAESLLTRDRRGTQTLTARAAQTGVGQARTDDLLALHRSAYPATRDWAGFIKGFVPFAWTQDAFVVAKPDGGVARPTQAQIARGAQLGTISETDARDALRSNRAVVTRNPAFSDAQLALAIASEAALLLPLAGRPIKAIASKVGRAARATGATLKQADAIADAMRGYASAVRTGNAQAVTASGRTLSRLGRETGNAALLKQGIVMQQNAALLRPIPAGAAHGVKPRRVTTIAGASPEQRRAFLDLIEAANKAVRDQDFARLGAASRRAQAPSIAREYPRGIAPKRLEYGPYSTTPAIEAVKKRLAKAKRTPTQLRLEKARAEAATQPETARPMPAAQPRPSARPAVSPSIAVTDTQGQLIGRIRSTTGTRKAGTTTQQRIEKAQLLRQAENVLQPEVARIASVKTALRTTARAVTISRTGLALLPVIAIATSTAIKPRTGTATAEQVREQALPMARTDIRVSEAQATAMQNELQRLARTEPTPATAIAIAALTTVLAQTNATASTYKSVPTTTKSQPPPPTQTARETPTRFGGSGGGGGGGGGGDPPTETPPTKEQPPPKMPRQSTRRTPDSGRKPSLRFRLPDGTELPEGEFPRRVTFLMGFARHTVDFEAGTRTIEGSAVSGEPERTFRVLDTMPKPPRTRVFRQGTFVYRVDDDGIDFTRQNAQNRVLRARNPFRASMRRR